MVLLMAPKHIKVIRGPEVRGIEKKDKKENLGYIYSVSISSMNSARKISNFKIDQLLGEMGSK
jgi:hypothetical protein